MRSGTRNDTRAVGPQPALCRAALLALACCAAAVSAAGVELPTTPPVARFAPDLDGAVPENYAVAQDGDGVAYLGNRRGVLVFDGERWTLVPSPKGDLVRSLAWDGGGRVYVGGYDQIGWIERDAQGAFVYHDLRASAALRADEHFADVWETHVLPQGVFFRGLHHVFRYEPASGRITLWRHPTRFGGLTLDGDELVLQFRPQGLRRLVGEEWQPIAGTESFSLLVERWIKLADGRLLGLRKDGRWATYRNGVVGELAMPAGVGPTTDYTRGVLLDDGTLALSGDDGMLRLVDLARGTTQAFDVTGGGFISGLMRARDGGLLLSADSGLYHVEWPTPWTALDRGGATGSLQGYARWGERRILLTGAGAYELTRGADGNARFEPRPWGQHPTWDLLGIDASTALLAENYALRVVDARGSREISASTLYPRVLQRSRFEPDVVFVGTELGFAVVRRDASGWRPVFVLDDVDAPNVTSLVETERGELMLGSERGGARRLRFADDWKSLREQRVFEAAEGIEYGVDRKAWLARFGALGVVASTGAGLFQWDGRRFVASDLGGLGALRTPQQTLALAEGPDGARWAWDFARIYRQAPGAGWQREDIDAVREGSLDRIVFDADGRTLFVANGSVLRHDPLARPAGIVRPMLRLTSVERVDESGARQRLPLAGSAPLRLEQGDFGINFRFATPELRRADGARYRARLVGYGEPFSDWSRSSGFTYSRLRPGAYRLELHARDARGNESEPVGFAFEILPRWYATTAALAAWTLFALGLLGFATRWAVQRRTQRLAADKQQLESMVEARTSELADANRKLDTIAHLDGLTGIPNRRKLDEYLEQVWVLCAERERPLAVLAIDVDRFKDYNDRHGHLAGDALLKRLAPILTRNLRRTEDLAARYGGEEFLVVLPGADAEVAREVAEALREKVSTSSIGATISVGVAAETPRSGREVTELVALADAALYRAKEAGRNRVVVSGA